MDNLFTSVKLFQYLKTIGVWCVKSVRANCLNGAGNLLKCRKEMEESGRGSMDYLCDINSNITVTKWLDNGVVQLLSTHVPVVYGGRPTLVKD